MSYFYHVKKWSKDGRWPLVPDGLAMMGWGARGLLRRLARRIRED